MSKLYYESEVFQGQDYTDLVLVGKEYEDCIFKNCIFYNTDLNKARFLKCTFDTCTMSIVSLAKTSFQDVKFKDSKLLGLRFDDCNTSMLSFSFENSVLPYSSFFKLNIKNTVFNACNLEEVEFVDTNAIGVIFKNCNLNKAIFENTILKEADFRTAYNFSLNPELNNIQNAKFSSENIKGLLDKYKIVIE